MTMTALRNDLLEFIRQDLIGPAHGTSEELEEPPKIRYVAGVLFPQGTERNDSVTVSGVEDAEDVDRRMGEEQPAVDEPASTQLEDQPPPRGGDGDDALDETVTLANSHKPAAMGMSFLVDAETTTLVVRAVAAEYEPRRAKIDGLDLVRTTYIRKPLQLEPFNLSLRGPDTKQDHEFSTGLHLRVVVRPHGQRRLVTLSLYNATREKTGSARIFFQVGFEVAAPDENAVFPEYRTLIGMPEDPEETALAMLYSTRRVFAVGHGCAVEWEATDASSACRLRTASMPAVLVPPVIPRGEGIPGLSMQFLKGDCPDPERQIPEALEKVCFGYEEWIDAREKEIETLEVRFRLSARENLKLCRLALVRMRRGVSLLRRDAKAFHAFRLMNRVMLMQQHHSRLRRRVKDPWTPLPSSADYCSNWDTKQGYWRTFQLAFVLMALPGLVPGEDMIEIPGSGGERVSRVDSRDLVDLIWFPTGGGKTEAYLAVTAFVVFMTRFLERERQGCLVLMRYTLRLLTSQQFQRASSLICACELVRRENPELFGSRPISIGLWVGMSLTPNSEPEALRYLSKLRPDRPDAQNPFQLLSCPWCGTELDNREALGYVDRSSRQAFVCPTDLCPFGRRAHPLPVCVVDESIYRDPPTLLIGTVDKFALLPWKPKAGAIFNTGGGPELIIQDELHLISGPLGSMVGLYESAIDYMCSRRRSRRAKVIASTATIRRAKEQCIALYDRPMFQFPPAGLNASDSFFAAEDSASPGRLYVGILPTASSSPLTAQIRTVVALQQGAMSVASPANVGSLDPYWTLVQYFGSLKELGRAATFLTADIPEFLPTMHRRWKTDKAARRFLKTWEELTSRKNEDEIPKILKRLETKFRREAKRGEQALDTVLATNMISVGVDVERLGLMLVVTQPKSTSEYIQASSRVGRKHPGLVVTLYNTGRPRDRSHYEHFRGYHSAFYRHVEPTSVTPFSPPAMLRALHALLITGARHVAGWSRPDDIDPDDSAFHAFIEYLRGRVRRIDQDHLPEFEEIVSKCLKGWQKYPPNEWGELTGERETRVLMRVAGTSATNIDPSSWETPTSMRNVDVVCQAEVRKYPTTRGEV